MNKIQEVLKININVIGRSFVKITGVLFSVAGFAAVFFDISAYFPGAWSAALCIIVLLILNLLLAVIFVLNTKNKMIYRNHGQKRLTVGYGDIFREESKIKVIAVNRCFDTEVNDELISPNSIHGKWIQGNLHHISVNELNSQIAESLKNQGCVGQQTVTKAKGKQLKYPVGTVAEVKDGNTVFYLLALTEMDDDLNSHCTFEDYCLAISRLMRYYDKRGQGYEMSMPILGIGFARLDADGRELLKLMISLIRVHQKQMSGDIKIVVYEKLKRSLSIADLE